MRQTEITIRDILVTAVIEGQRATFIDRSGQPLCRSIELSRLGRLADDEPVRERLAWRHAVDRMKTCVCARAYQYRNRSSWRTKADSLARSFNRRSRDHIRPRGRCRFEKYATTSWTLAIQRLWQQGNNRFRYVSRSGWHRWAYTIANNHNKKMGGRYAEARYRDGQTNPGVD